MTLRQCLSGINKFLNLILLKKSVWCTFYDTIVQVHNYKIIDIYGNFDMEKYDEKRSNRFITVLKRL